MKKDAPDGSTLARRDLLGAGVVGAAFFALPAGCGDSGAGRGGTPDASKPDTSSPPPDAKSCAEGPTHAVSIAGAGLGSPGTSTEISDSRYADPVCGDDKILVIHPSTNSAYVAMSGSCTHFCCNDPTGFGGPAYHASLSLGGKTMTDVVYCSCHGSIYNALDGAVLRGPATRGLQVLQNCVSDGFVFVEIPKS
jgi:Rieske Fe-S protein